MLPTISHAGDFVLVSPIPYYRIFDTHTPQRGDLVFAISPTDPRNTVCKRVTGVAGDVVEVEPRRAEKIKAWGAGQESGYGAEASGTNERLDGEVHTRDAITRNDDMSNAPLSRPRKGEGKFVKVPKGHVWLAGDNMSNSTDSRMYGPVPIGIIKGKVMARVSRTCSGW
jgi:inner membrane protease subunit 1